MDPVTLQNIVPLTKLLLDEDRLKILGVLALQRADIVTLSQKLGLKQRTLMRHMDLLAEAELIVKLSSHEFQFNVKQLHALKKEMFALPAGERVDSQSPEAKTLMAYLDGERLKQIPAKRVKLLIVLSWLVGKFDMNVRYPEKDINEIIQQHHPDYATLRRALVDHGFMQREKGVYWRII